ncbi:MAG: ABC transporter substrate-binding protein [Acidimicrobiia bacterium]|nr:ABC transporter substrate-binding protein [Acidimicrobiia bacterium]
MTHSHGRGARFRSSLLVLLVLGLLAPACGGGGGDDGGSPAGGDATTTPGEDAEPVAGGRIVYGLESESSGGWCLPEAQLALSGAQVARAVYEPLTMPNADGEYVPYLATAVTPNADFTEWTIELPEGVTFHDGSPLTAEVVKNNLDAFRGAYEGRTGLLLPFVYENIAEVTVAGPLTVVVTAKTPWRSFPAFLNQGNRFGIMGQAQLDDPDHCDENLVGTGPFRLEEWKLNRSLVVVRNESYRIPGLPTSTRSSSARSTRPSSVSTPSRPARST